MQSVSDDDVRKRLLEKPRFELTVEGVFRLGRCHIFWQGVPEGRCLEEGYVQGEMSIHPASQTAQRVLMPLCPMPLLLLLLSCNVDHVNVTCINGNQRHTSCVDAQAGRAAT